MVFDCCLRHLKGKPPKKVKTEYKVVYQCGSCDRIWDYEKYRGVGVCPSCSEGVNLNRYLVRR